MTARLGTAVARQSPSWMHRNCGLGHAILRRSSGRAPERNADSGAGLDEAAAGKLGLDTINYIPQRDGRKSISSAEALEVVSSLGLSATPG